MLLIAGDIAHSREFSQTAYDGAEEPKELLWIPGAGHVDLYDRVDLIPFGRLTSFFQESLRVWGGGCLVGVGDGRGGGRGRE